MSFYDFGDYRPPIRVDGGIKARSARGAIGESWWSKRFLAVLESFALGTRLTRGRSYARAGQVLSLDVAPGMVTASVQGSRPKPYRVTISLKRLQEQGVILCRKSQIVVRRPDVLKDIRGGRE